MTDKTPTRGQHDADTTTDRDVVSPTVAAQRLGITPDAVRARLRRGTISGERVDGDWQVFLPRDTTAQEEQHDTRHDADATEPVDRHDGDTAPQPDRTQELITAQREEITFLRDQLDHSRRELSAERERFDVIHREALSRIEALTAGLVDAEPEIADEPSAKGRRVVGDARPPTPAPEPSDEHLARGRAYLEESKRAPESSQTRDVAPGRAEVETLRMRTKGLQTSGGAVSPACGTGFSGGDGMSVSAEEVLVSEELNVFRQSEGAGKEIAQLTLVQFELLSNCMREG
jgi:hypothetical protein